MKAGCPAALNIKGEHFPCDIPPESLTEGRHPGLAHSNRDAGAIWCGNEGPGRRLADDECPEWCDLEPDQHWTPRGDGRKVHLARCPDEENGVRCGLVAEHFFGMHRFRDSVVWR